MNVDLKLDTSRLFTRADFLRMINVFGEDKLVFTMWRYDYRFDITHLNHEQFDFMIELFTEDENEKLLFRDKEYCHDLEECFVVIDKWLHNIIHG